MTQEEGFNNLLSENNPRIGSHASTKKSRLVTAATIFSILLVFIIVAVMLARRSADARAAEEQEKEHQEKFEMEATVKQQYTADSKDILDAIDFTVDPCEDFYQYACGEWLKKTELPSDSSRITKSFDVVSEHVTNQIIEILKYDWPMIGTMYDNCMNMEQRNEKGISVVNDLLTEINDIETRSDFMTVLGNLHANGHDDVDVFFEPSVSIDAKQPEQYVFGLWQAGLTLGAKEYYLEGKEDLFSVFNDTINKILTMAGQNYDSTNIINLENKIANLQWERSELRDPDANYNRMEIGEFYATFSNVTWIYYVQQLFQNAENLPQTINPAQKSYIQDISDLIETEDLNTLKGYLVWRTLSSTASELSQEIIDSIFNLNSALTGVTKQSPLNETCSSKVVRLLPDLVGKYYVAEHFNGDSKDIALDLVHQITEAFVTILENSNWMDETTIKEALVKLESMTDNIAYPEEWKTYYSKIYLKDGEYYENYYDLNKVERTGLLNRLNNAVDPKEWALPATIVNAWYHPTLNSINFPAGILQSPFFSQNFPPERNFGSIGVVIGHEMSHGFDDSGRSYDQFGALNNWWTEESEKKFEEKAKCVADLYSTYEVADEVFINGNLTQGESIADMGGVSLAYQALDKHLDEKYEEFKDDYKNEIHQIFEEKLTSEQLFFVSFAQVWCKVQTEEYDLRQVYTDPHPNAKYRVQGPLSSFEPFSTAFECPVDSVYNPEKKCKVW